MFSERLKEARKNKKYTQESLAKKLNTTKGTISNYENGHSTPSNEMLTMLADVLNVSVDYLLGRNSLASYVGMITVMEKATEILAHKHDKNELTSTELKLYQMIIKEQRNNETQGVDISIFLEAKKYLESLEKDERDIAKRLEEVQRDLENSDGLSFDGEPMSDEAKESLLESMELLFKQTQRLNKKFTPKKYKDEE